MLNGLDRITFDHDVTVHINGIPFLLKAGTPIWGLISNLKLAQFAAKDILPPNVEVRGGRSA